MKINWDATIDDFDGQTVKDAEGPITLCSVARNAINTIMREDENLNDENRLSRYKLLKTILAKGEIDQHEADIIKHRVFEALQHLGRGRVLREARGDQVETS